MARSLGSIWQSFSGQRPKSTSVEIDRNVVTCVIGEGVPDPDGDITSDARLSSRGLEYRATAAVAKATGRQVVAFIPKRDKKTEVSTQKFILDRPLQRG